MTTPKLIYRAEPEHAALLNHGEEICFPFTFLDASEYDLVDLAAGLCLSLGLIVIVEETTAGYRLTLDHPEAVPTSKT